MSVEQLDNISAARKNLAISTQTAYLFTIIILGVVALGVAVLGGVTGAFWATSLAGLVIGMVIVALVFRTQFDS